MKIQLNLTIEICLFFSLSIVLLFSSNFKQKSNGIGKVRLIFTSTNNKRGGQTLNVNVTSMRIQWIVILSDCDPKHL